MWLARNKIALLLWVAFLATIGSLVMKEEASLLFLIAFLAAFAAGIFYSINFYIRVYLEAARNK